MVHFSRPFLLSLAALLSLAMLLPAPYALAQGPVDGQNEETNELPGEFPVPEPIALSQLDAGDDPFAEASLASPPVQGAPEADVQFMPEFLFPGSAPAGNVPPGDAPFDRPPARDAPTGTAPATDARPALRGELLSGLEPKMQAALGAVAERLLERLNGWLHREADQVSSSFNRWLHQEIDRLLESLKDWLVEQLHDMGDAGAVELESIES
jgi:hypothetical protein